MEGRGHIETSTKSLPEAVPELGDEARISITNNNSWYTMMSHHLVEEEICKLSSIHSSDRRDEGNHLT
jgi:hypothetical protein